MDRYPAQRLKKLRPWPGAGPWGPCALSRACPEHPNKTGIDEGVADSAKRIGKTKSVNEGLWGWDRVLRRVIKKCMGTELTSRRVNVAIRNMESIANSGEPCKEAVSKVLDDLVAEGLAEDTPGVWRRGPSVRTCRWKTWEEIQSRPASEVLLSRLRLVEGDFRRLPPSAQAAGA